MYSVDDAPDELAYEIKRYTDWDWNAAASISYLESGWNWDAEYDTTYGDPSACGRVLEVRNGITVTAEHSISYFMINGCNYTGWEWAHFFNVHQNVGTAHDLWSKRGWEPWYFSAQELGLL